MTMYAGGSPYFDEKSGTVNKPNMPGGKRQLPKPVGVGVSAPADKRQLPKPVGVGVSAPADKRQLPKPVGGNAGLVKPVDRRPLPKPVAKPAGQLAGAAKAPAMVGAGKSPAGFAKPGAMKAPKVDALKRAVKFAKQRVGGM